jgi:hypothetical protein
MTEKKKPKRTKAEEDIDAFLDAASAFVTLDDDGNVLSCDCEAVEGSDEPKPAA